MNRTPRIAQVRFVQVLDRRLQVGLLGFVSLTLASLVRLDGLALRRALDGRLYLAFPERQDAAGRRHPIVQPISRAARRSIERQVLAALGYGGRKAS